MECCKAVKTNVEIAKAENKSLESVQDIDSFKSIFNKYLGVLNVNDKVKEMHARNISIIWKYVN